MSCAPIKLSQSLKPSLEGLRCLLSVKRSLKYMVPDIFQSLRLFFSDLEDCLCKENKKITWLDKKILKVCLQRHNEKMTYI